MTASVVIEMIRWAVGVLLLFEGCVEAIETAECTVVVVV